ncbi:prepilin peptidase [Longispora sp. NPDC051575]|uniref:prepilin peptidase n=1 Tax=Longispora sp. NPDC051575 TaxID=3154943 RepID=UPI0034141C93
MIAPARYNCGVVWVAVVLGVLIGPVLTGAADRWCPTPATWRTRLVGAVVLAGTLAALAARLPVTAPARPPGGWPEKIAQTVLTGTDAPGAGHAAALTACYAALGCLGLVLARVDLAALRLPDELVLPGYPAIALPLALLAPTGAPRALLAAACCLLGYGVLCAAGGLGFGDVKLGGLLGLATGWVSWRAVAAGVLLALALGAAHAVTRRLAGRPGPAPYGPAMLAGTLAALTVPL